MIKNWLTTLILLSLGVLFFASAEWFIIKQSEVERINQEYRDTIYELENITLSNQWLQKVSLSYLSDMPQTKYDAEIEMIKFYDRYSHLYNFKVSQFIYYDTSAKMDIGFSFVPKNQDDINRFLRLKYNYGFLQIQRFSFKEGEMSGVITLIQPIEGDTNASEQ